MIYLNYAGGARLSEATRAAMREAVDTLLAGGTATIRPVFARREEIRRAAAAWLSCEPDEVAFTTNTSAGLHLVAAGLDWRAGDEIVVFERDFPANVQPWRQLAARGVALRSVLMRDGGYDLADLEAALTPATRMVAVSHVHFLTGFRIDLDRVCAIAHAWDALVCVDAIQSVGAVPLSLRDTPVDFLAMGGHKWLCGPPGSGLFFCRRAHLDRLRGAPSGWFGYQGASDFLVKGPGHFTCDLPLRPSAHRFEGGQFDPVALLGLGHALDELSRTGIDAVGARIRHLTRRLREGLLARGYAVLSPDGERSWSGIVAFRHPRAESRAIFDALAAQGIHVAYPDGVLRASPHHVNSPSDVQALLEALPPV